MCKIFYYYNPFVKQYGPDVRDVNLKPECRRYYVDYFCSDGKTNFWAGCSNGDTPTEALKRGRTQQAKTSFWKERSNCTVVVVHLIIVKISCHIILVLVVRGWCYQSAIPFYENKRNQKKSKEI